jgi:predicted ATPase
LCRDGLALAEALAHPFTVAIALWATGILHQLRRESDATRVAGERMIGYCGEKGLPPMVPLGKVFRGDALARQGEFAEGIAQMREGIARTALDRYLVFGAELLSRSRRRLRAQRQCR